MVSSNTSIWLDKEHCRNTLKKLHKDKDIHADLSFEEFVRQKLTSKLLRDNKLRMMYEKHSTMKNLVQFCLPDIDVSDVKRLSSKKTPNNHWKDPKNVRNALYTLHKQISPNKEFIEFVYDDFTKSLLEKNDLSGMRSIFGSKKEMLSFAFPDMYLDPLKFTRCQNHIWKNDENIKRAVEIMFHESIYSDFTEFVYNLKYDDVVERFSSQIMKECDYSVVTLLERVGYKIDKPYKMKSSVPKKYWNSIENQRMYMDDFATAHNINHWEDWYEKLDQKSIMAWHGGNVIRKYNGSVIKLLLTIYPEFPFKIYKFKNVPLSYWDSIENQRAWADDFEKQHVFITKNDWYKVSSDMIVDFHGGTLKHKYCSLSDMVMSIYPEYKFTKSKFYKYGKLEAEWLNYIINKNNITDMIMGEINTQYKIASPNKKGYYYYVDGYSPSRNTVYEFLGDRWHGNPSRYGAKMNEIVLGNKSYEDLYNNTVERLQYIEDCGYKVVFIWESDWLLYREYVN